MPMSSDPQPLLPATVPFGSSHSILGLLLITMFIERSHMLTIPSTLALIRLMLAELSRPHGCDSGRTATGYIVGGLYTVRYLAALPRRVLLMGQQVLSCVARRTSTEATSRRTGGSRTALPPSRPLRTVRANFSAYRSSRSYAFRTRETQS